MMLSYSSPAELIIIQSDAASIRISAEISIGNTRKTMTIATSC